MKKLLMLMLVGSCGLLWAQTNAPMTLSEPETNAVIGVATSPPNAPATNAAPISAAHAAAGGSKTNAPATPPKPVEPTVITSQSADFDQKQLVYRGNVQETGPEADLKCELLTIDLLAGHVSHAYADTNVVIDFIKDGKKYHVTSARAVYDYELVTNQTFAVTTNAMLNLATNSVSNVATNETVTLTGSPKVVSADGIMTGEPMIWNRATGSFHGDGIKMIGLPTSGSSTSTNGLPLKLF
jgi:lipopolysaccharide export system protein LptA